ncbi:MAG: chloride channel protein [Alphaproteobacteria bacterium]|nr:chloride channel protein [Alphaproteobacteria bacterium]
MTVPPGGASLPAQSGRLRRTFQQRLAALAPLRRVDEAAPRPRARRDFRDWLVHLPQTLRALVRTDEIWLVALAAAAGLVAGLSVTAMSMLAQLVHEFLYNLPGNERLSAQISIEVWRAVAALGGGGLLLGVSGILILRYWPRRAVDPIEANALYGGRMSLNDSLIVVAQTMVSNGVGASVGLEAGYTQIGSALASRLGRSFRLRRNDLRLLVGCGAAGAIAAAFNAPLTGAFYAFELVIGTYSLATLAPVVGASIVAVVVVRLLTPDLYGFDVQLPTMIAPVDYLPILALGMLAALVGIAIMRGVTLTEDIFRRSRVPAWARPAIGGLAVAALAAISPQVLSSGHGALQQAMDAPYPLRHLALLVVLKAVASAVSIGSGFRGGLFFASLFLGALLGKLFVGALALVTTTEAVPEIVGALVGMSALAVAIVGGPLTMAFLALESTGSLPLTVAVVMAAVVSTLTVRRTFGYSFATWRFHLRGEAIRSAVDIGWMRTLTVARMMRREVRTARASTTIGAFRRDVPLGAASRVVVIDGSDRYVGMVLVPEAHAAEADETKTLADILHYPNDMLLPQMTIKEAVSAFEQAEADALAVVDSPDSRRVIGVLTEAYALRRYSEELERRRRELSGE